MSKKVQIVVLVVVAVLVLLFIAFCVLCQKEVGISPCGAPENYIKWNLIDSKPFEEKPISYVDKAPFESDRFLLTVSKDGTRMFGYEDITRKMLVWEVELNGNYIDHSLFFSGKNLFLAALSKKNNSNYLTIYNIRDKKSLWSTTIKAESIINRADNFLEEEMAWEVATRDDAKIEIRALLNGSLCGVMRVDGESQIFSDFPFFIINNGRVLQYMFCDLHDGVRKNLEKSISQSCVNSKIIKNTYVDDHIRKYSYVFSDGKFLFSSRAFAHIRNLNVGNDFKLPVENARPGFVEDMIFPYSDGICWIKDAQRKNDKAKFVKVIDGKGYEAITPLELNENSNDGHDAPEGFSYKSYLLKIGDRYKIVRVKEGVAGSVKFTVDNIQPFENGTEVYLIYYEDRDGALYFLTNRGTYSVRM